MITFVEFRAKSYSYLIDDCSKNKESKKKKCNIKTKLKFENYKKCLETTQLEQNKFSRKKIIIDVLKKQVHKKPIRNNISILKTQ